MQYFERLTKPNIYVWTGLFKQHAVSCDMEFYPENCSRIPATNLTEKDSDCHEQSCFTGNSLSLSLSLSLKTNGYK